LNYWYLILVAAGLGLSIAGFVKNGRSEGNSFAPSLLFLAGTAALTLGILLTCVPGFFAGN